MKRQLSNIYFKCRQKIFSSEKVQLKYLYYKSKNDILLVVFSGFGGKNVAGRFNYVRTLRDCRANKLFILDDFGYNSVGSYYLGNNCVVYNDSVIESLVYEIAEKCRAKKIVFAGSSKGGSAALLYGFRMNVNQIICGSPQYKIGDYLNANDYHRKILGGILPEGGWRGYNGLMV